MAEDPWVEGRQAWSRLSEWIQYESDARGALPRDGDGALRALGDVGEVRRLLDQAEFEAVRSARRQGRSWSEIAVRLGVTRQSAWERWRDLDDAAPAGRPRRDPLDATAVELTAQARERRRRATVIVPNVVGMSWSAARELLRANQLVGVDADGPALTSDGAPVADQSPESGAVVPPGSSITLWLSRGGGGSGVREPRRPRPDPLAGNKMREEITDEAV
ncbi:PASTA domain-containing protein [Actinophytocola sp.]|uniref:PASTA domain-containing protein n=1 Tax=Actinophytocola sp. TaxID=1872138 RepID=UPI002D3C4BB1|nr:PASTA domain-containing protein [Actinophytocola sp.]HYQ63382.1 PASTA domain-containing protein [Actinophytocola sp.]